MSKINAVLFITVEKVGAISMSKREVFNCTTMEYYAITKKKNIKTIQQQKPV